MFSSLFPIEEVGRTGGKGDRLAGPIDQEAEVGPRVILELAIDPLHRFLESLLHSPYFEFSISDFEFENPGAFLHNSKFAIPNPKYLKLLGNSGLLTADG